MRTAIKIVAALAAIAICSPASAAYRCKSSFTSNGNLKITKLGALSSAREVWKAQVRAQYGAEYANWGVARGKSSSCEKNGIIFNYQCAVTARPCR
jgi:hypothetical protein